MQTGENSVFRAGYLEFYHIVPLHYLPFVVQRQKLLSKIALLEQGFDLSHFRTSSKSIDMERGFANYIHATLSSSAPILNSKLKKGFPHIQLVFPTLSLGENYSLCRFNIARCRNTRTGKSGLKASDRNGQYYDGLEIPIAKTGLEQRRFFDCLKLDPSNVEVLIESEFELPSQMRIQCFAIEDVHLVRKILNKFSLSFLTELKKPAGTYPTNVAYRAEVKKFIDKALRNQDWRGNGLEFDYL